jgi:O-antigen ligase
MWRSGIGLSLSAFKDPNYPFWLKEHPLVGTGPGTIKVFFPKYRRPEYGRLEGGHNFTPDKLHNDYINLIATNGLIGFTVYYLLFLPFCFFIFHRYLIEENESEFSKLIAIGAMSGMMVYLGQVMFNFGVVATRVLFYELLAIAMVMIIHRPFHTSETK